MAASELTAIENFKVQRLSEIANGDAALLESFADEADTLARINYATAARSVLDTRNGDAVAWARDAAEHARIAARLRAILAQKSAE